MSDQEKMSAQNLARRMVSMQNNTNVAQMQQVKPQAEQPSNSIGAQNDKDEFSSIKRKQEASRLAGTAESAQKKATELAQAAAGAADPQERQKLLNEALQKEIEAESFGKTAKWLSAGSTQGFLVGSGIGAFPGITLGTLTGTLVGGLISVILGGLGGLLGAGVGAVHGPFLKLGRVMGGIVNKVVPTIPGWVATDEQKRALEKMLGQINDQPRPTADELTRIQQSIPATSNRAIPSATKVKKQSQPDIRKSSPSASISTTSKPERGQSKHEMRIQDSKKAAELQSESQSGRTRSQATCGPKSKKPPKKLEIRSKAT